MTGKQRNIRKRRALDEQEELSDGEGAAAPGGEGAGEPAAPRLTAEDIKALQKQRQRRTVRASEWLQQGLRWLAIRMLAAAHVARRMRSPACTY